MIKTIIIDYDLLAVNLLKDQLCVYSEIFVCGEFTEVDDALIFLKKNEVDIIFLDIFIGNKNVIDICKDLMNLNNSPDIIFVTAYSEYAAAAFELDALDYIVKPVTSERIEKTIRKIKNKKTRKDYHTEINLDNKYLKVYCLGETRIIDKDNRTIKFRTPKAEELFLYLVSKCKANIPKERIIDVLWPEFLKEKALSNLNSTIYSIRKTIANISDEDVVVYSQGKFGINTQYINMDFIDFEVKAKQIIGGENIDLSEVSEVIEAYTGRYLDGREYTWLEEQQSYFEEVFVRLLEIASDICFKKEKYKQAVEYLVKISEVNPYKEEVYEQVIKCYLRLGDRLSALKCYKRLEKILEDELGIVPNKMFIKLLEEYRLD